MRPVHPHRLSSHSRIGSAGAPTRLFYQTPTYPVATHIGIFPKKTGYSFLRRDPRLLRAGPVLGRGQSAADVKEPEEQDPSGDRGHAGSEVDLLKALPLSYGAG